MDTRTVTISGYPTRAAAERTLRTWHAHRGVEASSLRVFEEPDGTWTAQARFAPGVALPAASAAPAAAKIDPSIADPLAVQGYARVVAVLRDRARPASPAALRRLMLTPAAVTEAALSLRAAAPVRRRRSSRAPARRSEPASARVFPRLGVALGYMNEHSLRAAAASPVIAAVYAAHQLSLIRPVSRAEVRAAGTATWGLERLGIEALWKRGLTGSGVAVGHLDTGVDGSHPALRAALKRGGFALFDSAGEMVRGARAKDSDGHGTHTAGTLCGGRVRRLAIGVAPGASLFAACVIEEGDVLMRILAGMEWALSQGVRVLSMSLGVRGYTPFFRDVMDAVRRHGCLPVIAIGNEGPGTSRSPANYPEALSVGAVDRQGRVPAFSSSMAFAHPPHAEPDVVAPGVDVVSAAPGGRAASMDGTSCAAPHAAGVAALLMQAAPKVSAERIQEAIVRTSVRLPDPLPSRQGHGLIDPAAALSHLS